MVLNKEGKQYCFTSCLLLLCAMYDISSRYQATNLYIIYIIIRPILVVLVVLQSYLKPFKYSQSLTKNDISLFHQLIFALEDRSGIVKLIFHLFPDICDILIVLVNHVITIKGVMNTFKECIEYKYEKVIFDK